jgi:hypothetical protein
MRRIALAILLMQAACTVENQPVMSTKDPGELQAMQTRAFATADRDRVLRQVIFTLEDNGFSIYKIDVQDGTVSANKSTTLNLDATVTPIQGFSTAVHADAMILMTDGKQYQVDDPAFYGAYFYDPLSRNLKLAATRAPAETAQPAALTQPSYAPAQPSYAQPLPAQPQDTQAPSNEPWHSTPSP